jgi:hypothetical protein
MRLFLIALGFLAASFSYAEFTEEPIPFGRITNFDQRTVDYDFQGKRYRIDRKLLPRKTEVRQDVRFELDARLFLKSRRVRK